MKKLFDLPYLYQALLKFEAHGRRHHEDERKRFFCYLTEEQAQIEYQTGKLSRHIPNGFYCMRLDFSEWLEYYSIRIV